MFAKVLSQPQKIWRSTQRLREQVRSYKSTLCLSVRQNVGANLFAKGPVQPQKIRRSKQRLREQVRSYKSTPCSSVWQKCSELVRERARTVAEDLAFKTTPSRTSSLLQKHPMLKRTAKCRSELVRERARTAAEDLAFKTTPSRTSSLLNRRGPRYQQYKGGGCVLRRCVQHAEHHVGLPLEIRVKGQPRMDLARLGIAPVRIPHRLARHALGGVCRALAVPADTLAAR
ncbi:hypothetical protein SAMN05444065_108110 [Pseudomonas syringae]|uniref:Uncharacterized protein n=1 Tax=Pseudomonas syringae TaxID=317 RepID=A0AB38BUN7_PSESX|nr:hypothetical protein SAMN05444065_108110 [Pseudomonas syringae]SFO44071.1 hypothetical protein SAMN05444063_106110 [Pseudomonas syringae]